MEKLGNLFEFFVTTGIKTNDQDVILQSCTTANKKDLAILTIFPNPVERKMNHVLADIALWCFPLGVKTIKEGDSKFNKIEEYFKEDDVQASTNEINYFVINDFKQHIKFYCTSACFYEKMFIIMPPNDKLMQVFVPKAFCVISCFPAFIPQRSFVMQLLKIQKLRLSQNRERDKIITIKRGQQEYQIEEIKLYDFYIRTALTQCPIVQDNVEYRLKFSSSEIWMNYYVSNSHLATHFSIFKLSNNLFDVLIFNQPIFNLYKLLLYMMLEYQIIIVSRKPAGITLFCQSLVELLAPLQWRGLFIPFLRPGSFDFHKSQLPYIIGLDRNLYEISEKPLPKELKRVIYDIDDGRILSRSDDPKCPKQYQNYFIRKMNTVFADLKFYENEIFEEGIMKYRQAFYNVKLLMLNDIYKYFSTDTSNQKTEKKIVMFDYKKFLNSFESQDQLFFLQFLKTLSFQQFVKDLYKVMEYREEFIKNNIQNVEYNFSCVLQFFDDVRFLSIRFGEQTLDDKLVILENLQNNYIKAVLERKNESSNYKVIEMKTTDFIPEYLEHLKNSSLNLSMEMQALAKFIQTVPQQEEIVVEQQQKIVQQGGPDMNQSEEQDNISQESSKIQSDKSDQHSQFHHSLPPQEKVNWELQTIAVSNASEYRKQYQIKHLNLISKRNTFRKKNLLENEEEEEQMQLNQNTNTNNFIVTNIADKNMLSLPVKDNQSMAARSYFNKSMVPLIGDYGNAEIMVPNQDNMI
ncbi:unnamed protein product (macronuclear) [Paramecium tetraurelia]|uniref:UDENN domain-containing protein n=1 Tax=Paramecium tetraurelia TaxID=5888 RepID=A0CVQ9_PARTE|nr:uncharacterized protein GSPATT00011044001 [Paramecium tetraurelia]CAK74876.1 unnamed protein product [Paramecium tetraurelia]|eukprot:XP_001442273.1 hypothetical protein (macronuclear) [Paramecium tetraurelia strain d4-2]